MSNQAHAFDLSRFSPEELSVMRYQMERSFGLFCRIMFQATYGRKWLESRMHPIIYRILTQVYDGEIKKLIVNMPPRYGKTFAIVVLWVAWSLARSSHSRFFYTSYSEALIFKSSRYVRDIMTSALYQTLWPCAFRRDENAKRAWELEGSGGGLNAASVGGQVTGFGAGVTGCNGFSGAKIMDDPNNVSDNNSRLESRKTQDFFTETFDSRQEHRDIPTIVVQQRTCEDDITAYLLTDGPHGMWKHVLIQALIDDSYTYPDEFKFGDIVDHGLAPGALWEYKHTVAELEKMRDNPLTAFVFWSQYQQTPKIRGGGMIKVHWLGQYAVYNPRESTVDNVRIVSKRIYVDSAQKKGQQNDFSVFNCSVELESGYIALIDLWRNKVEAPELLSELILFVLKHRFIPGVCNTGVSFIKIEDKSSGTGLIQTIRRDSRFIAAAGGVQIMAQQRNTDKIARMNGIAPVIEAGKLLLPVHAPWRNIAISEITGFNNIGTAKNDDIPDTVMDALEDMLGTGRTIDYGSLYAGSLA